MTMAEFNLRAYAYRRQQQWDWAKFRMVAYWAVRAFNIAPKSMPKKENDIIQLPFVDEGNDKSGLSPEVIDRFKKAQELYNKQRKLKQIE